MFRALKRKKLVLIHGFICSNQVVRVDEGGDDKDYDVLVAEGVGSVV